MAADTSHAAETLSSGQSRVILLMSSKESAEVEKYFQRFICNLNILF
jgi:hypothetical protein